MSRNPRKLVRRTTQKHPTRNQDIQIKDPSQIPAGIWHAFRTKGETEGLEAPVFRALAPRDELPDMLLTASGWPVYSCRLADVFTVHAVCAPVIITFGRQREKLAYCLCVPKTTIDGLDTSLTLWKPNRFQPGKKVVDKAVLKSDIDWPPYFRIEGLANLTFVNDETQRKIEEMGLTGVGFEEEIRRS